MTSFQLHNKTILVTGASSGIGRQICITLSQLGANVILTGRNEAELNQTLNAMQSEGQQHTCLSLDLMDSTTFPTFVKGVGSIDGLVHCAGMAKYIPFKAISEKEIKQTQTLNYEAPMLLTQQFLKNKLIKSGGSIVFISSISALIGTVANAIYAGSKGAVISASRALALEVAGLKIRVNCISPGIVMTPLTEKIQEAVSEEVFKEKEKLHPLGFGTPEDVANTTAFLLAEASRWITGTNIVIDGGYTCQ